MNEEDLTPEQQRHLEAFLADLERELARVGVDRTVAFRRLNKTIAPVVSDVRFEGGVETHTVSHSIDLSGILETLRSLPDGAGNATFVSAYNAAHPDWRDRHEPLDTT